MALDPRDPANELYDQACSLLAAAQGLRAERLPDGADECAMCGADLKPLRPSLERRVGEAGERDSGLTGPRPIA